MCVDGRPAFCVRKYCGTDACCSIEMLEKSREVRTETISASSGLRPVYRSDSGRLWPE